MADETAKQEHWFEGVTKFLGILVMFGAVAFLMGTIGLVWADSFKIESVSETFYSFRNNTEISQERVASLERQLSALQAAYNKDHPDAKLGANDAGEATTSPLYRRYR